MISSEGRTRSTASILSLSYAQEYSGIFLTPAAVLAYYTLHARFEATHAGLRWRHFGRWTSVRWEEITDYYLTIPDQHRETPAIQVSGRRHIISRGWTRHAALLSAIEQHVSTPAPGWELLGCRPGEWSIQEFFYDPARRQRRIVGCGVSWIFVTGCCLAMGFRHFTQTTQTLGVGWALAQVGLFLLYDIPITLIITAVIAPEKEAFSRRRHTITTSAVGIRFSDGQRAIEAAWSDILAYEEGVLGKRFVEYSRNCIKTKQGDFDFTVVIHDQRHLCRIIDHWVPDTAREKPIPGEGVIGGEGSLWTGGQIGEGERVYHYRVSATRGLLLVYALFLLAPVLSGLVNGFGDVWRDKTIRIIEPLECISFLGCAWAYFHTSVTVTDNALIQRSLLGTIVIPWQDVVSYKNEEGMRQVISRSKHIRFSAPIADLEGLQTEIERRAVNSENKGWGKISRGYQGENHVTHN